MARALGATTCSSSVCGEASNTRRCICGHMTALAKPATALGAISISTIPSVHIRALTAPRRIRPTSPCCRSARQPNPGRGSTYRRGNSVQRFGTTADLRWAGADTNRIRSLAQELVGLQPDILLADSTPATVALQRETRQPLSTLSPSHAQSEEANSLARPLPSRMRSVETSKLPVKLFNLQRRISEKYMEVR